MKLTNTLRIVSIGVILAVSSTAANAVQTHHCKTQAGPIDTTLTKKKCLAAKGTWAKDAAAPAAAAPAKPAAAAPAPK